MLDTVYIIDTCVVPSDQVCNSTTRHPEAQAGKPWDSEWVTWPGMAPAPTLPAIGCDAPWARKGKVQ